MAVSTTMSLKGPYNLPLSLAVAASFSPEPSPDVTEFRSATRVNGEPILMTVRQLRKHPALLEIQGPTSRVIGDLKALAAWMLFAEIDLRPFYQLTVKHPRLSSVVSRFRGLKPIRPGSLFEMAVVAVAEQHISLAAAYRIRSRLTQSFGDHIDGLWAFPAAERLAQASLDELQDCGLSRRKCEYVSELAKRIVQGSLNLATLKRMSDDQARSLIMEQRGFGRWSADYILIRGLGRMDCVPVDDLAVRTIVGTYFGDGRRMAPEEVQETLQPFAPFRGLATFYILAHSRL
jgi:DNA-3-methyladenine glycosylase II